MKKLQKPWKLTIPLAMTTITVTDRLTAEAERYRRLAEQEALKVILNPEACGDKRVREHLLRAETFKSAAAIAGGAL